MQDDYRVSQFRRNWWDEKVFWWGGLTRNDLAWIAVGFMLGFIFFKFPINWDGVFGLRPR